MIILSLTAAQTLQEILLKVQARGLHNLHRATLLHALQGPLKIFEEARNGLISEYALKDEKGEPTVAPNGGVVVRDVRAFQAAVDQLAAAQMIELDPAKDTNLRDGLRFAKMVVSTDVCPALDGKEAFNFKAVYDVLMLVE